jgi:peptide/nickel transport system ATP-binding protein
MADAAPILALDGLSVSYQTSRGWLTALDQVSLAIPRGQAMGLVGESGSGKSTVVLAILGLIGKEARVTASRAEFAGGDLLRAASRLRGKRIGTVFQDPSASLNPALTIGLQVAEPMMLHLNLTRSEAFARATSLLADMGVPRAVEIMHAYPHQLSGGMKQRVMIAAALAPEPELLLLDEPTTALDVTIEAQILDLLEDLRARRGLSMLLVSHNLGIVDRICESVAVLYAGRVFEGGPTGEVLAAPRHPYTRGLLAALPRIGPDASKRLVSIRGELPDLVNPEPGCNFRPRCVFAAEGCEKPQALNIERGRALRCHRAAAVIDEPLTSADPTVHARAGRGEKVLVEVERLSRSFVPSDWLIDLPVVRKLLRRKPQSAVRAVDDVSLRIRSGEVLGLVGESGSGKSTLGLLMLRLLGADRGELSFDAAPVAAQPGSQFRRRAQIVFQNPDTSLNPRQNVETILWRPLQRFGIARGAAAGPEVERLLRMVRLPVSYRERYPHQLSGGEKQRVGIARALATRPDFLVCDEAVSALDVSVQAVILNLLRDLRDELKIAYLFITHDIGVVAHIADRIAVMYRGGVVEEGPVASVLRPPYHPYTEALLSAVPIVGKRRDEAKRIRLVGDPGIGMLEVGCRFASRCPRKLGTICDTVTPPWRNADASHRIACHIPLSDLLSVPLLERDIRGRTAESEAGAMHRSSS